MGNYKRYYRKAKTNVKKKRKKVFSSVFHSSYFWFFLILLVLGGLLLYFFFFSSFFQIKKIEVIGNRKTPSEKIEKVISTNIEKEIGIFRTKNIFLIDIRKAENSILKDFPEISEILIKRKFPETLIVKVTERKPVAIFCQEEKCFLIDKKGIIFEKYQGEKSDLIINKDDFKKNLNTGEEIFDEGRMKKIITIKNEMKILKIPLVKISEISNKRINILTKYGWQAYFNPERNLEWQLTELSILLRKISPEKRKNLKYIDLRFNKVYIYPEGII